MPTPASLRKRRSQGLTPDEKKDRRLRELYGLTLRQYRIMEFQQKGLCKICFRKPKTMPLQVDHDHKKPKRVRGILCFT